MNLDLILYVVAFVLFVLAGFRVATARVDLGWFGAAAIALALVL